MLVCYLLSCLFFGGKCCVSLLPQELSCPQEGLWVFELPSLNGRVGLDEKKRGTSENNKIQKEVIQDCELGWCKCNYKKTLTTTLHHWLSLIGRSLWDWTHLA